MRSAPLARAARTTKGQHRLGADGTGQASGRRKAPADTLPPDFLLVVWAGAPAGGLAEERVPAGGQAEGDADPPAGWRPHGWEETPDRAPLRMEARPFEPITWRDILEHVAGWLRARLDVAVERMARARIDA